MPVYKEPRKTNPTRKEHIYEKDHKYCTCTYFDYFSVAHDFTEGAGS